MSKDYDLESDSPNSKHELNETRDEINLDETVNEHCRACLIVQLISK